MRIRVFLICVLFGLMGLYALAGTFIADDPFGPEKTRHHDFDALAVEDIGRMKLEHLLRAPPYEVILFGNSRVMPVGAADLGFDGRNFFNASLSGQSLRAHILLLESLAEVGKGPQVALIALDNAELQLYANPTWAPLDLRLRQAWKDIRAGFVRPDIDTVALLRMVRRHLVTEFDLARQRLSWGRLRLFFTGSEDPPRNPAWAPDGSRHAGKPPSAYVPAPAPAANPNVIPGYLAYDFERLRTVAKAGTRIILFETFLHPEYTRTWLASPSPAAAATRALVLDLCHQSGFTCVASPGIVDDEGLAWADRDHPPQPVIARYIRSVAATGGAR